MNLIDFLFLLFSETALIWAGRLINPYNTYNPKVANTEMDRERVFYLDHFYKESANFLWRAAFERVADVLTYDYIHEPIQNLGPKILSFQPTHIHLGGSAKAGSFPLDVIIAARRLLKCSVSHFYEDYPFGSFYFKTAQNVDTVYISNKTHIEWAQKRGLTNYAYWPASPADTDVYRPYDVKKVYDVIFIGNNTDPSRFQTLKTVSERFNLTVFGKHWENTGIPFREPVFHAEYAKTISSAKVVLSIVGDNWRHLRSYFSNRLINCLSTGASLVQTYTPGIEETFEIEKHFLVYTDLNDLYVQIDRLLSNPQLQEFLSQNAREKIISDYSSDKAVERFLKEGKEKREKWKDLPRFLDLADNIVISKKGIASTENLIDTECPIRNGWRWKDHCGFLRQNHRQIVLKSKQLPEMVVDRMELWRECRFSLNDNGTILIENFQDSPYNLSQELEFCSFLPLSMEKGKNFLFSKRNLTSNDLDQWFYTLQWAIQQRFGFKRQDKFALEWYQHHQLTRWVLEKGYVKGNVLLLHAGLGEGAFALSMDSDCTIIAMEQSWIALQYAVEHYGSERLRFLPPCWDLFPKRFFDRIVVLTFPERLPSLIPLFRIWGNLSKEPEAIIGLYPLQDTLPPSFVHAQPIIKAFGKEHIVEWNYWESGFYAIVDISENHKS